MTRKLPLALLALSCAAGAQAQDQKLINLIVNVYGPNGLSVKSNFQHEAHFIGSFRTGFGAFYTALGTQLASVPLPSPASGFTYTFNPGTGVFDRSTQSFGPILSDRAETIGKKKLSFSFNYQRYSFDSLDGVDLGAYPVVFTHVAPESGNTAFLDVITTENAVKTTVDQWTALLNYGLSDRVDVSLAVPVVRVDLGVTSVASIRRVASSSNPGFHFWSTPGDIAKTFSDSGSKTGIGDVTLRVKGTAVKSGKTGLALGAEVRLPVGDEENLLGSGAVGVKPFLVFSWAGQTLAPHLKLAYQWNGKSKLAASLDEGPGGTIVLGDKQDLPDQFLYEAGVDFGLGKKATLAVDLLGRAVKDGERLTASTFTAVNGQTFPTVTSGTATYNALDGSVGVKLNPGGKFLVDLNVRFKLNDSGLRDKVTPLLGIEYTF